MIDIMPRIADALQIDRAEFERQWKTLQVKKRKNQPQGDDHESWLAIVRRWKEENVCHIFDLCVVILHPHSVNPPIYIYYINHIAR